MLEGELQSCTNNSLLLADKKPVEVGDFRADHVPGHSRGSVFYSNSELSVVFTGETWLVKIFHNSSSEVWLLQRTYAAILFLIVYIPLVRLSNTVCICLHGLIFHLFVAGWAPRTVWGFGPNLQLSLHFVALAVLD